MESMDAMAKRIADSGKWNPRVGQSVIDPDGEPWVCVCAKGGGRDHWWYSVGGEYVRHVRGGHADGALGRALAAGPDLGAAGTIGGLLSDARAKENIRAVGKLDNGIPIYSYRYKGSDVPQIGVMAQEAELTRPDAVMTAPDGVKYVNYDRVTR